MYQAYPGWVQNGQPMISKEITLPENANIIVMVLNESPSVKVTVKDKNPIFDDRQVHRAAFEEFFASMSETT